MHKVERSTVKKEIKKLSAFAMYHDGSSEKRGKPLVIVTPKEVIESKSKESKSEKKKKKVDVILVQGVDALSCFVGQFMDVYAFEKAFPSRADVDNDMEQKMEEEATSMDIAPTAETSAGPTAIHPKKTTTTNTKTAEFETPTTEEQDTTNVEPHNHSKKRKSATSHPPKTPMGSPN